MADNFEEGFDNLFGADSLSDTVEKTPADDPGQSKASKPAKSEPEEEEADGPDSEEEEEEEDSEEEDEDSDDSDDEDEEDEESDDKPKKKGDPEVPLKALRTENKELGEKVGTYDKMMKDSGFLIRQIQRMNPNLVVVDKSELQPQVGEDGKPVERKPAEAPRYVPDAPFYPNTPEGRADLRIDQRDVMNNVLPDVKDNQEIADMVLGLVAKGKSMVEAAHSVKRLLNQSKIDGKSEGKELRDKQITKKETLSKKPQPGNGKPSQRSELEKTVKKGTESQKLQAGADLLGFG